MRDDLRNKLFDDFPSIFRRGGAKAGGTWEVAIGDGWFGPIYKLAQGLQAIVGSMPESECATFYAAQVKEKFADLRFYMSGSNDEMRKLISIAESECARSCTVCGKNGWLQGEGWDESVRCGEHGLDPPMKVLIDGVEHEELDDDDY